jgi:hypothetical protein
MKINLEINLDLWVARDVDDKLFIYKHKPKKHAELGVEFGVWGGYDDHFCAFGLECIDLEAYQFIIPNIEDYFDFSQVQWEDSEPKQLKDIVRSKNE